MTATIVTATDLRTKTRDILERAKFSGEHFVVESFGKPMVAILGVSEYNELMTLRDRLSNPKQQDNPDATL